MYIQNRGPHDMLKDKTPEEVFSGIKPEVGHLIIFGCPVYIHVPKEKRTKMEPSSNEGVFVGYSENSKAYKIYVPGQRQIEVSREVTFHEEAAFKKSRELQQESKVVQPASPSSKNEESDDEREEPHEGPSNEPLEPDEVLERTLEEPLAKRKPGWLKEIMQEAERIVSPKGTFRERKRPHRFGGYVALMSSISDDEPSSFEKEDKLQVWKDAMLEEYMSIIKNNVWDIVPRPKDKSMVSSKWIYKIKHVVDGSVEKFKEIFVAKGFTQKEGIDYEETFSLVARYTSIRIIISLASVLGWKLHQMDVKTTFLNGKIEQEVFVEQPDGFVLHNKGTHVCKIRKALYGLKKAPRFWYDKIDGFLKSPGFHKSDVDANLYFKVRGNQLVILIMYVDDIFIARYEGLITWCKRDLTSEFEMKDLGLMHYFLGLEVWQRQGEIFLAQGKYTMDVLKRFGMMDCKFMSTPMVTNLRKLHDSNTGSDLVDPTMYRQLIGSLMYMIHTRPDICYVLIAMSQFMTKPRQRHWVETKNILRYIIGTITYGLRYTSSGGLFLHGYADVDSVGSPLDWKSTSG
jgi:hypothetical protein